jgi:hypothetical protein
MARQNLELLQEMCKTARKAIPTEWPEGLLGIGFDMREWVRSQEDAPTKSKAKAKPKTQPDEE